MFMGARMTHAELDARICRMSRALGAQGMKRGDRVLVCLPNIPQAVIIFYALNRLGAIPAMIHPLSAPAEIRAYARRHPAPGPSPWMHSTRGSPRAGPEPHLPRSWCAARTECMGPLMR